MSASNRLTRLVAGLLLILGMAAAASAANRTWIGGNNDWDTSNANWNPADEPDVDDVAIFNTPNSVDLVNASEQILGLTMSGGIDLSTNGSYLAVSGLVQLSGGGTNLIISGGDSVLQADAVIVNSGADIHL